MLLDFGWLALMSATTTFIPWMVPLTYAAIAWLQLQQNSPHQIFLVTVVGAVVWTMLLWLGYTWCSWWILKHITIPDDRKEDHMPHTSTPSSSWIKRKAKLLYQKLHIHSTPKVLFSLVVITALLPIPDLVVIMHVHKKMPILSFFVATVLWKALNYAPIIYGIELGKMMF